MIQEQLLDMIPDEKDLIRQWKQQEEYFLDYLWEQEEIKREREEEDRYQRAMETMWIDMMIVRLRSW
jgi:hypothetical protein